MVAGIDVQFVVSGCSYPLCWHADELEDNSTERDDFLRFYDYLCHVIDDFACFDFAALR